MSSTSTSIGRGPASGGNENHDGDPCHTTLGESVKQEPPAGSTVPDDAPEPEPAPAPEGRIPTTPAAEAPATA